MDLNKETIFNTKAGFLLTVLFFLMPTSRGLTAGSTAIVEHVMDPAVKLRGVGIGKSQF
ncbi:Uncharacterised protein [Legionella lansingensis]|uniref:Uncharacterized protein n=1 Tax=Legionella lansingensis TaxID=45067 RepID=A0A0W0VL95_9GAMM|nr:hypothetical protein Llan_1626 [Legionella lansingensis]SNV43859.1 Uncharacterised protein [Legionella lansingensis]